MLLTGGRMRAIRLRTTGGPEVLEHVTDLPDPEPQAGEVLIDVSVAGINFRDINHRTGSQPTPIPGGIGLEGLGRVLDVGEGVADLRVGQRVAWCDRIGSYASHLVAPADRCVPVPDELDGDTACGLMLQGLTAHYLTRDTYPLVEGSVAVVHAASGGVGRLLVQLARHAGARVVATTTSAEKAELIRELGADEVVVRATDDLVDRVMGLTDGRGADVVYDSIGATTWDASLRSLRRRGTAVLYGSASGPIEPVDPNSLAAHGSLLFTRPRLADHTVGEELRTRAEELFALAQQGVVSVVVHERYPLQQAAIAQAALESGSTAGKLLLYP